MPWAPHALSPAADADTDPEVIELNCAGPRHINFRDVDGTLTGTVGSLMGFKSPDVLGNQVVGGAILLWGVGN
jgi:hypothetical protein